MLVGAGGAAGSLARTALGTALAHGEATTLVVNLTGAVAIGLLLGLTGGRHRRLSALLGTGLLGGWTTFSAVSLTMAQHGTGLLVWLAFTVIGSITLAWSGLRLGRLLSGRR
ncbi:MAG: CrcB family protein [Propionibacteriales bacterium]|nr:CrcB family protein [Propionibacteriales bacterium]